jgi:hypothetical protein
MDSLVGRYFLIERVGIADRTAFDTGGAAPAFILDNVSGFFRQCYPEVTRFAFDAIDFGIAQYLYVRMPADLDQFR